MTHKHISKLKNRYGNDTLVKKYLRENIKIDACQYYTIATPISNSITQQLYILLPFIFNNDKSEYVWNNDKLVFGSKTQLIDFCETLNIKLMNEN